MNVDWNIKQNQTKTSRDRIIESRPFYLWFFTSHMPEHTIPVTNVANQFGSFVLWDQFESKFYAWKWIVWGEISHRFCSFFISRCRFFHRFPFLTIVPWYGSSVRTESLLSLSFSSCQCICHASSFYLFPFDSIMRTMYWQCFALSTLFHVWMMMMHRIAWKCECVCV